jgi:hypothetical protein
MATGSVKCWGYNAQGELGDGTTTDSTTPVSVTGLASSVVAISSSTGRQTCALETSGGIQCWGANYSGELGNGTTTNSSTPVDVTGLTSGVLAISAGGNHSCAVTSAGAAKCWGSNGFGALGNNSNTNSSVPVNVFGLSTGVAAISAGEDHTCAVTTASIIKCWGENFWGQVGDGTTSTAFAPVTVALNPPGAPTGAVATPGDGQATVTWSAPSSDGGGHVIRYTVTATPDGHQAVVDGTTLSAVVSGLTNGTSYTFTVVATNSTGNGPPSLPSNAVIPTSSGATVPEPPTNVTATPGNARANVTWSAPSSDGGSSITGYTVTANPGGQTASVNGSTFTANVTGLSNGTSYTFTVIATNMVGDSDPSSASNAVTPRTVPGAPTNVVATAGNQSASVTWSAPSSNGGSPITSYTVTSTTGGFSTTVNGTTLTAVVSGLTNGTSYKFRVVATNAAGDSAPSAQTNAVTPRDVPGPPTNVTASPGNASATVSWTAPLSNGGSALIGYVLTASPGGATKSVGSSTSSTSFTGLTNGTSYTFTIVATNAAGNSVPSAPSNAVTPRTVPGAPTNVVATAGNQSASVTWSAPSSNGGSPITSYTVTSTTGGFSTTVNGTTLTAVVSGLTNGTSYKFRVVATNAVGSGPQSTQSNAVIPQGVPGSPTNVTASPGNASATVSWTAPLSNGGSTVTSYTVAASPGSQTTTVSGTKLSAVVAGLTNGTSYTFTVSATNAIGTGPSSLSSAPVSPSATITRIVFASASGAVSTNDLYLMNADGTNRVPLLTRSGSDTDPEVSPDGSRVVFVAGNNASSEIWVMKLDGSGLTQLTSNGSIDTSPTWSPDGTKIAFSSNYPTVGTGGDLEIWVMNSDGSNAVQITSNTVADTAPDWSPETLPGGVRIAWSSNLNNLGQEIWTMKPDGSDQVRLTLSAGANQTPKWSPDGTKIAFTSSRDGDNDILLMNVNGSSQIDLTTASDPNNRQDVAPSWSLDSTHIAFSSTRVSSPNYDIYTMLAEGTGSLNLTGGVGNNGTPDWF